MIPCKKCVDWVVKGSQWPSDKHVLAKWRNNIEDRGYFAVNIFGKTQALHPECKARMLQEARLDLMFYLMEQHPELDVETDPLLCSGGKMAASKTRGIGLTRGLSSSCRLFHFCLAPLFVKLLANAKVVNTLDFPQYVPPGQEQDYEGHTGRCPVTALLTLTNQKVKGTTVPAGTLVIHDATRTRTEQLFPFNDTIRPWLGLRVGYWPLKEEKYTFKQRMALFQERFRPVHETGVDPFATYEKRYFLGYYDTTAMEFCMEKMKPDTGGKLKNARGKSQVQGTDQNMLEKEKESNGGNEKRPNLKRTIIEQKPLRREQEIPKNSEIYSSESFTKSPKLRLQPDKKEISMVRSSDECVEKKEESNCPTSRMTGTLAGHKMINSQAMMFNGTKQDGSVLENAKTERDHVERKQRENQFPERNQHIPTKTPKKRRYTEQILENSKSMGKEYRPVQKLRKAQIPSESDDCILIEHVPPKKASTIRPKRQTFSLTPESKARILKGKWLDADAINFAQQILCQSSKVRGFQPTTLSESLSFEKIQEPFVQILFDKDRSHWLCISLQNPTNQNGPPIVNVYDSLGNGRVTTCIEKQIEAIVCDWKGNLVFPPVQQQLNDVDCGVFAIAFATHAVLGKNPAGVTYNTNIMRKHLLQCLENKVLSLFPTVDMDWQEIEREIAVLASAEMERNFGVERLKEKSLYPKPKPKNILWTLRDICRIYEKKRRKPDNSLTVSQVLHMHKCGSKEARHWIGLYAAGMLGTDEFQERMHSIVSEQISCILFMRDKEGFARAYQCTSGVGDLFLKRILFNYKAFKEMLPKGSL